MSIDTAAPADVVIPGGPNGSPADINPGSGNYGDEGATSGAKFINDGELVGFVLKANDASKGVVSYENGFDATPATMNDIIIRLYSDDTLLETINHDVTGAPGSMGSIMFSDDAGRLFNRVEVEAGAGGGLIRHPPSSFLPASLALPGQERPGKPSRRLPC